MEIHVKEDRGMHIVEIHWNLGISTMKQFKEKMASLIESGAGNIILSFEHTKYIDSSGISALISFSTRLKKEGIGFRFANIKGSVAHVFEITHLDQFFPISKTVEDARKELEDHPA